MTSNGDAIFRARGIEASRAAAGAALLLLLALLALAPASCTAGGAASAPAAAAPAPAIRAGFVYSGPAADMGWNRAHETGRRFVEARLPWLDTVARESVSADSAAAVIDGLIRDQKCRIVFLTSQIYSRALLEAQQKHPGCIFMHCSGVRRAENAGTYYIDIYQIYYLNGLMAGALTRTDRIGYAGAFPDPEVIRHINAFALGVKEVNPRASVDVRWLRAWFDPAAAELAANGLIRDGCDVIGFTEDSAAIVGLCQKYAAEGRRIFTFGHYGPMQSLGPDAVVSGHMVSWGILYKAILEQVRAGTWRPRDWLWAVREDAAVLGAATGGPVNPKFVPALKEALIDHPDFGRISVFDLVMKRLAQLRQGEPGFEPFTGPLNDREGRLRLGEGEAAGREVLWSMDWFADNVKGPLTL